ncbi:MAG: hypothetical protein VX228_01555 [Pseudomonadota bacterium]|nr:hypothetical protein [Pseudomonadota bacterium]
MDQRVEIQTLIATEDHELAYMRGTGNRLVVSLGGVGTKPEEMPPFEFVGTASQGGTACKGGVSIRIRAGRVSASQYRWHRLLPAPP